MLYLVDFIVFQFIMISVINQETWHECQTERIARLGHPERAPRHGADALCASRHQRAPCHSRDLETVTERPLAEGTERTFLQFQLEQEQGKFGRQ